MSHVFIRATDTTLAFWRCSHCGLEIAEWRLYSGQLPPCRRAP